ncbi:MAG TPA: hypothetical protein VEY09_16930 [Pyrinomonadaceae bacterium]|nr:hypothetical protein [Pyrinomonadaceae bacterium]
MLSAVVACGLASAGCGAPDRPAGERSDNSRTAAPADTQSPAATTATPDAAGPERDGHGGAVGNAGENANENAVGIAAGNANVSGPSPGRDAAAGEADSSTQSFEGTAGLTEKKAEAGGVAVLREVRSASHTTFDRVVFEFDGRALPGYRVDYVDRPVRQCGSGRPVRVAGDGWLLVRLEPAKAHTEAGRPTVRDRDRRPGLPNLKELKLICDFEAQVEWVLGLGSPNRYRVLELQNPARLVIDVKR